MKRLSGTPGRRFRDDWDGLMLFGGIFSCLALVLLVGRLGRSVEAGTVAQCSTSYNRGYRAHVVLEDGRRYMLDYQDLADAERCLPPGARVEKRRNTLDLRLNGRPFRWPGRGFVPELASAGVLLVLIGERLRRLARRSSRAAVQSAPRRQAESMPAREIWLSTDPVLAWLPAYVLIVVRNAPVAIACGAGFVLVYLSGGLSFVLFVVLSASGVAFAYLQGALAFRRARARLERALAVRSARQRAGHDARIVSLRGRVSGAASMQGMFGSGSGVYRQLALRGHGRFLPAQLLLENAYDFELIHAQGRTAIDVRQARWLCAAPQLRKLDPEPARELTALLEALHLHITVVAAGEALLHEGDEVEVIGFRASATPASGSGADSVLGSEGGVPLLVIPVS